MSKEDKFYDTYKKIRRDWADVKPITKVMKNKKKYNRKEKHKKQYYEEDDK